MKILLIIPPMTQINTPYPATAYLTSFLKSKGYEVSQRDLGLDLFLKLFSKKGLALIKNHCSTGNESVNFFLEAFDDYQSTIESVIRFLQGQDPTLALRISNRNFLPEGPRFLPLLEHSHLLDVFGELGMQDKALYLASLYLDDIADVIKYGIDDSFGFSRYGESLAASQNSFNPLYDSLKNKQSIIDDMIFEITEDYLKECSPGVVGFTIPFPGNLLGALKSAQYIKSKKNHIKVVMGGGYVNTELREISDPRIFEFIDFLTFDDGERPLECILEYLGKKRSSDQLLRTMRLENNKITWISCKNEKDPPFKSLNAPTYEGLNLRNYVSMMEMPNPMHRMWTDFRWNKLILAHGCYWKKCTFCDVNLDYIGRFEPAKVENLIEHIKTLVNETGTSGFHFVDEAAPPALLKSLSDEIIKQKLKINWWGNLRFDVQFSKETAQKMADAGCIAVTGGLEVASPRLLKLINKGVDIEQVARVTKNFSDAGIFVHAYLMYGFPTQTTQETIDSLEIVRQLFENECIQSAYWHRFLATVHSPVGRNPEKFGIKIHRPPIPKEGLFAINEVEFEDPTLCDHTILGLGLKKALYNYMHGIGISEDVRVWFDLEVPKPKLSKNFIASVL